YRAINQKTITKPQKRTPATPSRRAEKPCEALAGESAKLTGVSSTNFILLAVGLPAAPDRCQQCSRPKCLRREGGEGVRGQHRQPKSASTPRNNAREAGNS